MNRTLAWLVTPLLLACVHLAEAQQPEKVHRIGFLGGSSASAYASFIEAFKQGLRDLGYTNEKILIESRYGGGKLDRLPELAAELVNVGVDVIVVSGARAISQMKSATKTIPIVMTTIEDPVALGLIESLARPGGNITGLTNLAPELSGKRLELLKEAFPKISHVSVLWQPDAPGPVVTFKETQVVAATLGVQLHSLEVRNPKDFEDAFKASIRERTGAFLVLQSALTNAHRRLIVDLAARTHLPRCTLKGSMLRQAA